VGGALLTPDRASLRIGEFMVFRFVVLFGFRAYSFGFEFYLFFIIWDLALCTQMRSDLPLSGADRIF
jgi:hypothetical protein